MSRPGRALILLALLLGLQTSLGLLWYATPDATRYLSIARSIAAGGPLRDLGNPQLFLPPGYPLLLAPAFLAGERPFVLLTVLQWTFAVVFVLGVHRWAVRHVPDVALGLTALVAVHPSVWFYARRTLSETAFMAAMMWTVFALDRVLDAPGRGRALGAGLALAGVALIREVGIVLAGGFALAAALRVRRGRLAPATAVTTTVLVALPAVLAVAGFSYYDRAVAAASDVVQGTRLGFFDVGDGALGARLASGLALRTSEVGRLILPGMWKAYGPHGVWRDPMAVLYAAVLSVLAIGWWRLVRRGPSVLLLALPLYFAVYAAWPGYEETRYMTPVVPALLAAAWAAVAPLRPRKAALIAVVAAQLVTAVVYWVKEIPERRACQAAWPQVDALAQVLVAVPRPIVAASMPECVRLMLQLTLDRRVGRAPRED